jgi:hypothetical protein
MGQPIKVTVRPDPDPDVLVFDTDRSLTGTDVHGYSRDDDVLGNRPYEILARAVFEINGVMSVSVSSNVITVRRSTGADWDRRSWEDIGPEICGIIENLFIHYDVNRVDSGAEEDFAAAEAGHADTVMTAKAQSEALHTHLLERKYDKDRGRPARRPD